MWFHLYVKPKKQNRWMKNKTETDSNTGNKPVVSGEVWEMGRISGGAPEDKLPAINKSVLGM